MISKTALFVAAALYCAAPVAVAERPQTFPGSPIDSRTLRTQEKVDELFERGDFERAMFIYRNELAPIGDKYAQYMIGYMYWTGTGVAEDLVSATAWFRLAAERGNPEFVALRDQLLYRLSDEDLARSDAMYLDLRQRYSDAQILLSLVRSDVAELRARTGSRVANTAAPLTIVELRRGSTESADSRDRRLRKRARECLRFLGQLLGEQDFEDDPDRLDLAALEERVRLHVTTIEDRPLSASEASR